MRIPIVIAFKADSQERRRNLEVFVRFINESLQRRFRIIVAESGTQASGLPGVDQHINCGSFFSRCRNFNAGGMACDSESVGFADSDILVRTEQWIMAYERIARYDFVKPFDSWRNASSQATSTYAQDKNWDRLVSRVVKESRYLRSTNVCGGIVFIRRSVLDHIGWWDERFVGHGAEDNAMDVVANKGPFRIHRVQGLGIHQHHPVSYRRRVPDNQRLLRADYRSLEFDEIVRRRTVSYPKRNVCACSSREFHQQDDHPKASNRTENEIQNETIEQTIMAKNCVQEISESRNALGDPTPPTQSSNTIDSPAKESVTDLHCENKVNQPTMSPIPAGMRMAPKRVWFSNVAGNNAKYWEPVRNYFIEQGFVVTDGSGQRPPHDLTTYDHIVIWNGERPNAKRIVATARKAKIPHWFLEVGFFSQRDSLTLTPRGSVGGALMSERESLTPITDEEEEQLKEFFHQYAKGQKPTEGDYILAPLQLAADCAVSNYSPFRSMQQFIDHIEEKYPNEKIIFRPHPKDKGWKKLRCKRAKIELTSSIWQQILPAKEIVGINSTTLYEAVLAGKRVTAIGDCPLKRFPEQHREVCREVLKMRIAISDSDAARQVSQLVSNWPVQKQPISQPRYIQPKVSICIPLRVSNPSRLRNWNVVVAELTALAQRRGDVEIIAAEWDGEHAKSIPFIRRVEGTGDFNRSRARNQAWQAATSDLICFCDSDIIMSPRAWDKAITIANRFDCFSPNRTLLKPSSDACIQCLSNDRWNFQWTPKAHGATPIPFDLTGGICFMNRSLLESMGGWDERFIGHGAEDLAFTEAIQGSGFSTGVGKIENPVHLWHHSDPSDMSPTIRAKNNKLLGPYQKKYAGDLVIGTFLNATGDAQRKLKTWEPNADAVSKLVESVDAHGKQFLLLTDCLVDSRFDTQWSGKSAHFNAYAFRWISVYRWLLRHAEVQQVFLVDSTDVEMLHNPFPHLEPGKIYVGYEDLSVGCKWLQEEAERVKISDRLTKHQAHPLLNCGVVGGNRQAIMMFLDRFVTAIEASLKGQFDSTEMAVFNDVLLTHFSEMIEFGPRITTRFKKHERTDAWFRHK